MNKQDVLRFFFELGHLKQIKHEGWRLAGVPAPESVAEHALRAAQIGYVLANMEKHPNPAEIACMLVFHDIGETRVGDIHRLAKGYLEIDEERAVQDQLGPLGTLGESIAKLWTQVEHQSSPAGQIAKDADELEQALTAKEYLEQGYQQAKIWIDNVGALLRTESAKSLHAELMNMESSDWWTKLEGVKSSS